MTKQDVKISLIVKGWTFTDLASKMGCSTQWIYKGLKDQNTNVIDKIKEILK